MSSERWKETTRPDNAKIDGYRGDRPVWITRNSVQPYKNPTGAKYASRKYTYCPPACGNIAQFTIGKRRRNRQAARQNPGRSSPPLNPSAAR